MKNKPYVRYGDEWKKEMMKLKKETIIDMYKNLCERCSNNTVIVDCNKIKGK